MNDEKIKKELLGLGATGFVFDTECNKIIGATFKSKTDAVLAHFKIQKINGQLRQRVFKKQDLALFHPTPLLF